MSGIWLWAALTLLVVSAILPVVLALAGRRRPANGTAASGLAPLLAGLARELADLDRQQAEGALAPAEAAARKGNVRRRLEEEAARLAAEGQRPDGPRTGSPAWLPHALAATVVVAAAGLYGWMGRPDAVGGSAGAGGPDDAGGAGTASPPATAGDVQQLVQRLEARLQESPEDAEGWRMLGWSRFELGDHAGAAQAYARAVALAPGSAAYLSALGEAQVMAADGAITPAARASFRRALAADPTDARARYYLAAARDQDGDTRGAIEDWLKLVAEDPAAPWVADLRSIILDRAEAAGLDVAARLPPPPAAALPPGMLAAPTPDQVAEASAMSPEDRQAMIRGMVDGLEARLRENPRDLGGWQRLMRARMVLGEEARARAAYADARRAFAGRDADLRALEAFAREIGLPGA